MVAVTLYRNYDATDFTSASAFGEIENFGTPESRGFSAPEGKEFQEWNSKRDGTGDSYGVTDLIPKSSPFYVIWGEAKVPVEYITTDTELFSIADAIRTKGDTSEALEYPDGFVTAINAISTGTDVSDTTATAADVLAGKHFYTANGTRTQGSIATKTSSNMTANGATVTAPAGYYATAASKAVASGSATTPATTITAQPSISVNASGLITATNSKTQNVTPTVSAGYVSAGTAGTITVSGSNTNQLPTQAAQTITPTTTDQTIASGKYLTGTQTIKGDANLIAENIAKDVTIFGVTGTHEGGGGGTTKTVTISLTNPSSASAFKSFTIYELESGGVQGKQIGSISSPTGSTTVTIDPTVLGIYCELRGEFVALPSVDWLIMGMLNGNIGLLHAQGDMPNSDIEYIVGGDGTIEIMNVEWSD